MKTCENCSSLHNGQYGSGRFCSSKCARGFSTKNKRSEINEQVSKKLSGRGICVIHKQCEYCNKMFSITYRFAKRNQKYCSSACNAKALGQDIEYCKKLSAIANERVRLGLHKGWQNRKIRSYPELFFENVLIENNIKFESEFKIKKSKLGLKCAMNYFLDFYLPEYNIDLEIDGKQHEIKERKIKDKIRDDALVKFGIYVYRIKWKNPINEVNNQYIKNEINQLILFLKNLK